MPIKDKTTSYELEHTLAAFVRAFGLHQSDQTPCGITITVSEAHTLTELARTKGLSQTELTSFLKLEKSTVSRLILNLSKKNWLERKPHPTDKRANLLMLTLEGEKKAAQVAKARRAKFDAITNSLPHSKREAVLSALSTLTEVLNETENVL